MNKLAYVLAPVLGALIAFGCAQTGPHAPAAQGAPGGPKFAVDPYWPRPLAENRIFAQVAGLAVDSRDHVWIIHRPRTLSAEEQRMAAPPVLEFDAAGNFIQGWGGDGQGYEWPQREHGIFVDHKDNVWIGGNNEKGRKLPFLKPIDDTQILKFTRAGKFVLQIGRSDQSGGSDPRRAARATTNAPVPIRARGIAIISRMLDE